MSDAPSLFIGLKIEKLKKLELYKHVE